MRIIGDKTLPCGHHKITKVEDGLVVKCRTCRRKVVVCLEPAQKASQMTGWECVVIRWEACE